MNPQIIKKLALFFIVLSYSFQKAKAQSLNTGFGILGKIQFTIGNQNQKLEAGIFAIGVLNYNDVAIESGLNLISGHFFKRHTIKQAGFFYGYEFFALAGVGQNSNLLGASVADFNTSLIANPDGQGSFSGLGFGFQKEYLPKELKHFSLRRGKILMRFSNADHSLDFAFLNDFKFYPMFNGEGTDYGSTGSLQIGFSKILSSIEIYRVGTGVELFTPKADHTRTPDNYVNSDDGRKNVWYTVSPHSTNFYSNLYAFGTYQGQDASIHIKLGINSQKLGAYIQNTLHDGPGLNPRFPWDVTKKDKLFFELSTSITKTEQHDK